MRFLLSASIVEQNLPNESSLAGDNLIPRNNNHIAKPKTRKKSLRRRLSGGAEILCPIVSEAEPSSSSSSPWYRFKRNDSTKTRPDIDMLISRRRGSLPVEVLTITHSGKATQWNICGYFCALHICDHSLFSLFS